MLTLSMMLLLAAPDEAQTKAVMRSALHAVVGLQPYLGSPDAFRDPANRPAIDADLATLATLEHRFAMPGRQDAAVETLAGVFGTQIATAQAELRAGNTEAPRARLRAITSLCFACHTRESVPNDFIDATRVVDSLRLPPLRRAEFFATTRQFELALQAWSLALKASPASEAEAFDQAVATRQYLAVLVRVKDDRQSTMAAITRQLARKDLPTFTRLLLEQWQKDAKAWQADAFDAKAATATALVAKARALVEASGAMKSAMSDEGLFIPSLRAAGYLHAALDREPQAIWRGEALYLLAIAAAATLDPQLWELEGLYLEACIREKPHSDIARKCSARMYDRAWFGFTGSGGTRIPDDVAQKLATLRQLAK